jgi:CHAT domain-containing protein
LLGFAYDWSIARLYPGKVDANEAVNAGKTLAIGLSPKRAEQFTLHVPNDLQERQDRFKVIATTIPVDFTHFLQEGLPSISSSQRSYFRSMQSDIELLLLSPSSSHNSGQSITNDWTTAEITVRTVPQGYSEQQTTQLTLDESFYTRYHTYQNFDLLITRSGDGYQARVISSPAGEAVHVLSTEAEQFLRGYETSLEPLSNNLTEIQKLGAQLFDALFHNEVLLLLREIMRVAASRNYGLRIHLRFSETPELASLPWEYLYDQMTGRFLALSNATLLVRFLELPPTQPWRAVEQPLKILVVLASPQDSSPLELEAEWQKLQSTMQTQVERGVVALTRLEKATITALQQQLRQDKYHIFHFAGHGYANSARNEGFLLFEDEERHAHSISSLQLGVLLRSFSSLRLVVLNTSHSAPIAYRLCEQGIMAVVGLQNSFSDVDSIQLTNTFYSSLAAGESVDIALATTRRVLYLAGGSSAWGTPVLVSGSSDNRLFSLPRRGLRIDPQTSTVWVDGRIVEALTPREFDLLVCLAEEPGRIYETETILTNLYPSGEHVTVDSGYVAALVRRVRAKIERDPSNPQYLLNVRGQGYRLLMEAE